jgi:hypothetical protein
MFRIFLPVALIFIAGCSHPRVTDKATCRPIEGADAVLNSPSRYIIVGEMHGTAETPAWFAELVCTAVADGLRVLVGLEFDAASTVALDTYVASEGSLADREKLLQPRHWLNNESPGDGRTSVAMFAMLERLRELQSSGMPISVAGFVGVPLRYTSQTDYEKVLAENLQRATESGGYDKSIVLVGDLHASQARLPYASHIDPMAMHLPRGEVLSLRTESTGGHAWHCSPGCSVHPVRGHAATEGPSIVLTELHRPAYDGVFNIGRVTASLPLRSADQSGLPGAPSR